MKSKMGKEGSKKCDNKKQAGKSNGRIEGLLAPRLELSLTSRGQDQASDCLGSFSFLQILPEKCRSNPSGSLNHIPGSLFWSGECFTKGAVPPPSIVPPPGPWGQALSAGGSSQTHCLDWCWVSLTAGEEFLSSPWLIPAHQFRICCLLNRSTHPPAPASTPPSPVKSHEGRVTAILDAGGRVNRSQRPLRRIPRSGQR